MWKGSGFLYYMVIGGFIGVGTIALGGSGSKNLLLPGSSTSSEKDHPSGDGEDGG
jgi:hypothetical protein